MFDALAGLRSLYDGARRVPIDDRDRVVVLSDLHLGNGGSRDDFAPNGELCLSALSEYYLPRGFHLVLNGDVEELQRFGRHGIRRAWPAFYEALEGFRAGGGLTRLEGNHDEGAASDDSVEPALRFEYGSHTLFAFHGHQAAAMYHRFNPGVGFALRYLANPLRIGNRSVAHSSERQFRIERRVYQFSIATRIASVIGHTHRPLFESMSKTDEIRFRIESLCRRYPEAPPPEQAGLAPLIASLRHELGRGLASHPRDAVPGSLYGSALHVPCMFNSGCCIGKRGATSIEIAAGRISLVHWFRGERNPRRRSEAGTTRLPGTGIHRLVLKEDSLRYVFARIDLLSGGEVREAARVAPAAEEPAPA